MYHAAPFQSVPVRFSVNGISIRPPRSSPRKTNKEVPRAAVSQLRLPHISKWHLAADLLILQMVLLRQIHPERSDVCWQTIADLLVERGYLQTGLTAGSVKSRFVSLMHNAVHPNALSLNKLYDRLAILFHGERSTKPEHSVSTSDPNLVTPAHTLPSTQGPDATLEDKQSALKVIDHAALRAHCAEALNTHHSQRPDVIARKRQLESPESTHQQSIKTASRDWSFRFARGRMDQLPTPPPSDPIDFSASEALDGILSQSVSHKVQPDTQCERPQTEARTSHPSTPDVQFSNNSRKRSYTQISDHQLDHKIPIPSPASSVTATSTLESIIRADILQKARQRDQQARARLERQLVDPQHARNLYLSAVSYKHQNRKRETCYIRYRPGSQTLHPPNAGVQKSSKRKTKNKSGLKTKRTTNSKPSKRRTENPESKTTKGRSASKPLVPKRQSHGMKSSSNRPVKPTHTAKSRLNSLPQSIILPSDTEDDAPLLLSSPTHQRKWKRLVARITRKRVDDPPTVDVNGSVTTSISSQQQKEEETNNEQKGSKIDVVQEVYNRVKRKRIERAGTLLQ